MARTATLAETKSHNVPPDVFLKHRREIAECKSAHDDTGMALARAKKAAKSDGIDLDALKMLEKLANLDDDEAEIRLRHLGVYAKWSNLPYGTQLDMFGTEAVSAEERERQDEWDAGEAGKVAGTRGEVRDSNPNAPGTSEYVAWDKAWATGNKAFVKTQKAIAKEMDPGKSRGELGRGRPRGARANGQASTH